MKTYQYILEVKLCHEIEIEAENEEEAQKILEGTDLGWEMSSACDGSTFKTNEIDVTHLGEQQLI